MADINVERRSRSIWPWVVGLLVLAALAWLLLSMLGNDDNDNVRVEETTTSAVVIPAPALAA